MDKNTKIMHSKKSAGACVIWTEKILYASRRGRGLSSSQRIPLGMLQAVKQPYKTTGRLVGQKGCRKDN
ncbi:hypothetical protein P22_1274 [Propionispora sp. 2/2-37]|uniref:hypothetical protein n=1 Tax=Propionispora sp. 2/2-37 TaxID=1677858 RepID=UPI0006BB72B6|nr:hypothetical protein [Propionispora sp. 2/2-37]CUH95204.1 hypothetical protein P22_1274 [Propionispora sp. 2/2-37]